MTGPAETVPGSNLVVANEWINEWWSVRACEFMMIPAGYAEQRIEAGASVFGTRPLDGANGLYTQIK